MIMETSLLRSVLKSSFFFIVARGLGALLPLLLARRFGVSPGMDAFFVAFAIHSFIATSVGSVCEVSVVPYLARASKEEEAALLRSMLLAVPAAVLALTLLLGIVISFTLPAEINREYWRLTLFPVLSVGSGILIGALNTRHHYTLTAVAPGLRSLAFLAMFFLFPVREPTILAGCFTLAELFLLLFLLRESGKRAILRGGGSSASLRELLSSTSLLWSGFVLLALNPVTDKMFAKLVGTGGVSIMEYAFSIFYIPANLLTGPLLTILFTRWSHADRSTLSIGEADRSVLVVSLLALGAFFSFLVVGGPLLRFLLAAKVPAAQVEEIRLCTVILLGGLLPYAAASLYARLALAMGHYRLLALLSAGNALLNLLLDFLLYRPLGLDGIVISTVVTYGAIAVAIRFWMPRALRHNEVAQA